MRAGACSSSGATGTGQREWAVFSPSGTGARTGSAARSLRLGAERGTGAGGGRMQALALALSQTRHRDREALGTIETYGDNRGRLSAE